MERQTLISRGPGPAAVTPTSHVQVDQQAYGDYNGLKQFGAGMQNLGLSIADKGEYDARVKLELERRKQNDTKLAAQVSAMKAADASDEWVRQQKQAAEGGNIIGDPKYSEGASKVYNDTLSSELQARQLDTGILSKDEFYHLNGYRDNVIQRAQVLDGAYAEGKRTTDLQVINDHQIGQLSDPNGNPTAAAEPSIQVLEVSNDAIINTPGIHPSSKNRLVSQNNDKFSLIVPALMTGRTPDERSAFAKRMVDAGFSPSEANALTRQPTVDPKVRADLVDQADAAISKGDTATAQAKADAAAVVSTPEQIGQMNSKLAVSQAMFVFRQSLDITGTNTSKSVQQAEEMLKQIDEDATGSRVFFENSHLTPDQLSRLGQADGAQNQSQMRSKLASFVAQAKTNINVLVDKNPQVAQAAQGFMMATHGLLSLTGTSTPDERNSAMAIFTQAQSEYASAALVARAKIDPTAQAGSPDAIPEEFANQVSKGLATGAGRSGAGRMVHMLSQSGPMGQKVVNGLIRSLATTKSPEAQQAAGLLSVVNSLSRAGGPASLPAIETMLANYDPEKVLKARNALDLMNGAAIGKSKIPPKTYVGDVMENMTTSYNASAASVVFEQKISSSNRADTLNRYAQGIASINGVSVDVVNGVLRDVLLSMSSDEQGQISYQNINTYGASLLGQFSTAGMTTVNNPDTGLVEIGLVPLDDSRLRSVLEPTEAGAESGVDIYPKARQALADWNNTLSSTAALADRNWVSGTNNPLWMAPVAFATRFATNHPVDAILASFEGVADSFKNTNFTWFGTDVGQPDMNPGYMSSAVGEKFGFRVNGFPDPIDPSKTLTEAEFRARTSHRARVDGGVDVVWDDRKIKTLTGGVSRSATTQVGLVYTVTPEQVMAAVDYFALQGTSFEAKMNLDLRNEKAAALTKTIADPTLRDVVTAHGGLSLSVLHAAEKKVGHAFSTNEASSLRLADWLMDLHRDAKR